MKKTTASYLAAFLIISTGAVATTRIATTNTLTHNRVCRLNGLLPDSICTPGSINSSVTQSNIHQTICVSGWTRTVRPSVSYTNKLKRQSIKDYGYTDTSLFHYEEDHLISLELGGNPTDLKNLWAEPGSSPNPKDNVENILKSRVCSGAMLLADAQRKIASNWTTALN